MGGKVETFADITPARVSFNCGAGRCAPQPVSIKTKEELPFKILNTRARDGKYIRFRLEELSGVKPAQYLLTVENIRTDKGRYADIIFLDTDNMAHPDIQIPVMGNIGDFPPVQ